MNDILGTERTISATEFKATCLELLDQVASGEIAKLTVTKRGTPVAVVRRAPSKREQVEALFGMMKGSVIAPPDYDFTEPAFEGVAEAELGLLSGEPFARDE